MFSLITAETCPVRIYRGISEHAHRDFWEAHYFTRGRGFFHQNGTQVPVPPGTWAISPPRVAHRIERPADEKQIQFVFVQFRPDKGDATWLANLAKAHPFPKSGSPGTDWLGRFQEITDAFAVGSGHGRSRAGHLFQAFLLAMADLKTGATVQSPLLQEALVLMGEAVVKGGNMGGIARALGVDPSTLWRAFHQGMGVSPVEKFLDMRLAKVRKDLVETRDPIGDIAERYGFTDGFHLSRTFRRRVGISPRMYRQRGAMV